MRTLLVVAALALAGTPFEWETAKGVHVGSTRAEMVALLGKPYMVKTLASGEQVWIWSYASLGETKLVSYGLKDGLVTVVPSIVN
jgi:hypothetical protein